MIRKALAVLSALAVSACLLAPGTAVSATHEQVFVRKFNCEVPVVDPRGDIKAAKRTATTVRVGDAVLTAGHVSTGCADEDAGVVFPSIDLAILQAGKMVSCREPKPGEPLRFYGYPGTDLETGLQRSEVVLEWQDGEVTVNNVPMLLALGAFNNISVYKNHTSAKAPNVRRGYSGGAVVNRDTGEFLGIISTASPVKDSASFIPANIICEKMEALL
jgi:hypothetical protein